jgi:hypothetical protein
MALVEKYQQAFPVYGSVRRHELHFLVVNRGQCTLAAAWSVAKEVR